MGVDLSPPIRAGQQAQKITAIEAVKIDDRSYAVEFNGRSGRLRDSTRDRKSNWRTNRPGWTVPEILHSILANEKTAERLNIDRRTVKAKIDLELLEQLKKN